MKNDIPSNKEYGYPSLAKISSFLRKCIGDTPLLYIEKKLQESGQQPYREQSSVKKSWDRLCSEDYKQFENYKSNSIDGIYFLVEEFLNDMKKKYNLSSPIIRLIFSTYTSLYDLLKISDEQVPFVPDFKTKNIVKNTILLNFKRETFYLYDNNPDWENILEFYLSEDLNYSTVFPRIKESLKKTWETIYTELDNLAEKNKIKDDITIRFEKILKECIRTNNNPSWSNFRIILEWAPDELNTQLLEIYLLNNYKQALEKVFFFSEDELNEIRHLFITGLEEDYIDETDINDSSYVADMYIKLLLKTYPHSYKDKNFLNDTKTDFFEYVKENNLQINQMFDFFEPWLKGYIKVTERRFGAAKKLYKQAFESRYLAGNYILQFLKQAFVLELYDSGSWLKSRQAAEQNTDNTTPVCPQAQYYWNYGYALDFFDKPASNAFLESYKIYQNFYNEFPPEIFEHPENVRRICLKELLIERGISLEYTGDYTQKLEKLYNLISSYTNEDKSINDRIKHPLAPHNDKEKRLYTPFSLCIIFGTKEERFLQLAERWINFDNILVGKRNFNNSTSLLEALTQYKQLKYTNIQDENNFLKLKRYKQLIHKIIDKTELEDFCETKIHKIHVLQEAINAFDLDIIKHIIDKGLNINELIIDTDEISPLYYAVARKGALLNGYKKFYKKFMNNKDNLTWRNYDCPGLTALDKAVNQENLFNFANLDDIFKFVFTHEYGVENSHKLQISELEKIILYFIEKISDVDAFKKIYYNGQGTTALFLAAEYNDVELCKLLIKKGADPISPIGDVFLCHIQQPFGNYMPIYAPNSFIYRLIFYEAWNTLSTFLTQYKEIAIQTMKPNNFGVTPVIYSVYCLLHKEESKELLEKFIPLFVEVGANLDAPSYIGSGNQLIEMLKED